MERVLELDRWLAISSAFACKFWPGCHATGFTRWGLLWPLLAIATLWILLATPRRQPRDFFAALFLLGLGAYLSFYLLTPHNVEWHLTTSLDRLLLQLLPLLLIWIFASLPALSAIRRKA
jgi:hypothetical protein